MYRGNYKGNTSCQLFIYSNYAYNNSLSGSGITPNLNGFASPLYESSNTNSDYIFSVIIAATCSVMPNKEIKTYGIINEENIREVVLVDAAKYNTYKQLYERVEEISCNDSIPALKVQIENIEYQVGLSNPCWHRYACILISSRNVLDIEDEKILADRTVGLDSLEEYISKHYNNYGKLSFFSDNPKKAMISINYRDMPITSLNTIVKRIVKAFDKLQLETPLVLSLKRILPPPPPPPPPPLFKPALCIKKSITG